MGIPSKPGKFWEAPLNVEKEKTVRDFTELDIDGYIAFAKHVLTPGRFEHSLGVMQVLSELAPLYALDHTAALACGILHDVAKELPLEEQLALARKGKFSLDTPCDEHPMYLHGPAGACYIHQELDIQDPVILDTIARHTYFGTGAASSPVFCWCLRFADVLEAGRSWKELQRQLQPLVYAWNIREGAYLITEWLIPFLGTKSIPAHPNVHRVLDELSSLMEKEGASDPNRLPV